jgi:hypothetical protein
MDVICFSGARKTRVLERIGLRRRLAAAIRYESGMSRGR